MAQLSDEALRTLLWDDPPAGWRAFTDQHTPTLLELIHRAGILSKDDAMEVYVLVCERLAADNCRRLRGYDPSRGSLRAWLASVTRHVVVDWARSRVGRLRLPGTVRRLSDFDQNVFRLYYREGYSPAEIAEMLTSSRGHSASLVSVLDALERIEQAVPNHYRQTLWTMGARGRPPGSLETDSGEPLVDVRDGGPDPEAAARARELDALLSSALAELPPEDAAIIALKYVEGLTHRQIERALHLERLSDDRVKGIVVKLRRLLQARRIGASDVATLGVSFLEGTSDGAPVDRGADSVARRGDR